VEDLVVVHLLVVHQVLAKVDVLVHVAENAVMDLLVRPQDEYTRSLFAFSFRFKISFFFAKMWPKTL
jgi:hypothetical protein